MQTLFRTSISLILLTLGFFCLPTAAAGDINGAESLHFAVLSSAHPVTSPRSADSSGCLTIGEVTAILGGAVVMGAAADTILGGGPFTVLGVAAGAALGSLWYKQGL